MKNKQILLLMKWRTFFDDKKQLFFSLSQFVSFLFDSVEKSTHIRRLVFVNDVWKNSENSKPSPKDDEWT